jgi:hypothetical protein
MERFLRPIVPEAVRYLRTAEELLAGLWHFASRIGWSRAHDVVFAIDAWVDAAVSAPHSGGTPGGRNALTSPHLPR